MRLLCNGVALDLEAGATMSFKKINPLFAFDKLTCERTQAFKLPATPTNDRVLELAKVPAYYGSGMRRRFDAELQDGTVVKNGYLYVDKYDKGSYSAVFVTGELFGLLKIKDAGKIADFYLASDTTVWGNPITSSEAFDEVPLWQSVRYEETYPNAIPFPSYNLAEVIFRCFDQLGVPRPVLPQPTRLSYNARVIPGKLSAIDTNLEVISTPMENSGDLDPINALQFPKAYFDEDTFEISNGLSGVCEEFEVDDLRDTPTVLRILSVNPDQRPRKRRVIKCLRAKYDCELIFDANAPALHILREDSKTEPTDFSQWYQFYAPTFGWYANGAISTAYTSELIGPGLRYRNTYNKLSIGGQPITGRSFQITAGTRFTFFDPADLASDDAYQWVLDRQTDAYYSLLYDEGKDYFSDGQKRYSVTFAVRSAEPEPGNNIILQPNLPDITLVDACNTIAHLTGTALNYSDDEGLTFERLGDYDAWPMLNLNGKVVNVGEMSRRFGSYSQHNIVKFDSADTVYYYERMREDYTIDSNNISESEDLYTIPFSEGGIGGSAYDELQPVLIRDIDKQGGDDTIACAADWDINLGRVWLTKNDFIQRLCDASTCITLGVRMTLGEYEALAAKVTILYAGTRYVWTEAQYSKGVATLKLSKIPD